MDDGQGIARRGVLAGAAGLAAAAAAGRVDAQDRAPPPATVPVGRLELFLAARAPTTPTGLAISRAGRVFVFMPRFDDKTMYGVGEVARDGGVTPWPDAAINRPDPDRPQDTLFFVPGGVFDARDRMWIVDAGLTAASGPPAPGAAKLMCFDLGTGKIAAVIPLGPAVEPTSSLNDLRVDAEARAAFVTDQGQDGRGAVIAVDLVTGRAVRRLARHSSTMSNKGIVKIVEGRRLMRRGANGVATEVQGGANGIALSPDSGNLYYAPLMGRHLHSVPTAALLDPRMNDAEVAAAVEDLGEKGLTGGLLTDARDRVYLTLQELNAVGRRGSDGEIEVIASDPRLIWPDTLCIRDGWLYVSSAQVNRRPEHNGGVDRQRPPYAILRTRLD